ncbi:MAG TPA: gamma-glutamyl-gamma-aminobutyrate hydrolase family protein [Blastocatellia bacterium]|nr:gamma-glutamyl-gamma-aminobutyrate hydrolase family protein [Blastocatellia bacterium]
MAKVIVLQHEPFEKLGTIADALRSHAISYEYVRSFEGQSVPRHIGEADGLIVMGGSMGVYEHHWYPFLLDEIKLIETAIEKSKPVLGVCLGSQLLATALGARVTKAPKKEIGWYPVRLRPALAADRLFGSAPESFVAFHWHGDFFEVPSGAAPVASSELTEHQAFRYGEKAYGLLFHMEATRPIVEDMVKGFAEELAEEHIDGQTIISQAATFLPGLHEIGRQVFNGWAELVLNG